MCFSFSNFAWNREPVSPSSTNTSTYSRTTNIANRDKFPSYKQPTSYVERFDRPFAGSVDDGPERATQSDDAGRPAGPVAAVTADGTQLVWSAEPAHEPEHDQQHEHHEHEL